MKELIALFNTGRHADLHVLARAMLARDPENGSLWKILGASLWTQQQEAIPALQAAARLLPFDAEAHCNLGNALSEAGRFEEALASLSLALNINPHLAEAHSNMGNILRAQGKLLGASYSYRKAIELQPRFASAHSNLGNALRALGQLEEAESCYRQALVLRPQLVEAQINLGNVLRELGRPEDAVVSCRDALRLCPFSPEAHNNLGNALLELKQLPEAIEAYSRALECQSDYAQAHSNLAAVMLACGQPAEAQKSCGRALALDADFAEAHLNLGNAFILLKKLPDAAMSFRRALAIDPDYVTALKRLAFVLSELAQPNEATELWRRASEIDPDNFDVLLAQITSSFDRGLVAETESLLESALQRHPDRPELHCQLGFQRRSSGDREQVERSLRRAQELRPDYPPVLVLEAELHADAGDFAQAEARYRQALDHESTIANALSGVIRARRMTWDDLDIVVRAQRLAGEVISWRHQATLRFSIGKALDDLQEYESAFINFRSANELMKAHWVDNAYKADSSAIIQREHEWCRQSKVETGSGSGILSTDKPGSIKPCSRSQVPVFIFGMPRSGTTLAEQILASHPQVYGAGELSFWPEVLRKALQSDGKDVIDIQKAATDYLQLLQRLAPNAQRVVDKRVTNYQLLGILHMALPGARFIHMRRHPIDTCLSIYFQPFGAGYGYGNDLDELAARYRDYQQLMTHWRSILPSDRLLEVPVRGTDRRTRALEPPHGGLHRAALGLELSAVS